MARRRFSVHDLVRAQPPLTAEQIADWWVKKNLGAITEVALKSMTDPVGFCYTIYPLRIIAFQSGDSRIDYQLSLHHAAKAHGSKHVVADAITQHIEDLALFCRQEFLKVLLALEVETTFQCDRFAYVGVRDER